jgi:hypothetical protein
MDAAKARGEGATVYKGRLVDIASIKQAESDRQTGRDDRGRLKPVSHDPVLAPRLFGLAPGEWVAGIVHIGTATQTPPDRPRPDLGAITTWVEA